MRKVWAIVALMALAVFGFAVKGDPTTLVDLTISEPDTMDPHYAYDTASGEVIYNVYENLIAYNGESVTDFVPRLATKWEVLDGGKTYKFYIRKGVKFHLGGDLTPEDVEYSFERGLIFDPAGGPMWMLWEALFGIDSLEGFVEEKFGVSYSDMIDENGEAKPEYKDKLVSVYTDYIDPAIEVEGDAVVFHLVRPFAPFMAILAQGSSWSAVLDKEWAVEVGCWDGKADTWWKYHDIQKEKSPLYAVANGTGPYKLVEWDRTQQKVTLEANENYWREPAKIKKVVIWGVDEWATRRALFEKGDGDVCYVPAQFLSQIEGKEGIEIIKGLPTISVTALHFNWSIKSDSKYIGSGKLDGEGIPPDFFSDEHVRKAFSYAFNYDAMILQVLRGLGKRVPYALPEGLIGYNPDLPMYEFNLLKAREEFKKAFNGELWKKGFKMTLLYNTGNSARQTAAEMLKFYIEQLNPKFKIEVRGVQWPTYLDTYRKGYLPAFIIGWLADYPDPHNFIFTYYHSNGVYGHSQGENYEKFVTTPLEELGGKTLNQVIEEAVAETDPAKRQEMYESVAKVVYSRALGMALYQPLGLRVHRSWLKGWYHNPMRPGDDYYAYSIEF
ncbi:MAG: ABC transporter substrate-binding protein [Thermotogae bacterium]|nr:MAG: ABC transporter substrate-binding protein [Thermotogota bacterium]